MRFRASARPRCLRGLGRLALVAPLFASLAPSPAAAQSGAAPSLSIDSPSVTEGDSGATNLAFTLTLSAASTEEVRVRFSDKGTGTATAGTDYPAFSIQWLYFQPGELTKTVSISVTGDTVKEPNETIVVELLYPLHATIATPTGTGTITDDDTTPGLSISSPRVTEGDGGSADLTYTVSLTAASTEQVTVNYADAGTGTATSGTDYTAITGGTLTFAVGATSQDITVSVTGDTDVEPHETVAVSLSSAANATISTATGTGTIVNDDGASSLSVSSLSVTEADTAIRFTVTLSTARSESARVTWWDTGEGTATAGQDYGATRYSSPGGAWLTFAPGEISKTTDQIHVRQDGRDEGDETIIVAASEAADGTGRVTGTATIKDDDGAPSLSIDSPSVTEGDSGSKNLTFTVTLDKAGTRQVTLDWAEGTGGTATSGTDYAAITGGTLTFAAGTTSQTFDVSVTGDTTDEADETVVVTLSNASGATISTGTGTGTITDDDDPPSLSIDSPRVAEGDSGSKNLTFTVKLSAASGKQVTVDWAEGTGGTATSGTDHTVITGGSLTFAVGTTSRTFNVSVTGDTDEEPNETVVATLSNAANATISTATGTGTIVNDDGVTVSIDSPSVTEGDSGSTNLTFTATLSKASTGQVTVDYADAGTGTATSGTDYTAITGGTLTFAVGITSQTFDVSVTGDTTEEADETVIVTLSNAANATISTATGTGTITDNDGPSLSIDSPSVTEGDSGSKTLTFTVTLNKTSTEQVTVDYADAGSGTATSGTDYTAVTGGTLTFAAGTTSRTFDVSVTGDTLDEADETVMVTLSNAANAAIGTATGTGTITDNDPTPSLSIDSPSVTEGDSGSKNLTFTVKLSAASGQQVTVDWAGGTGGTATSGTDYTAITGGTLTFAAGTTSQTFNVSVTGDTTEEADETVVVTLSNAANAAVSTATGTGTITDDDGTPTVSIDSPSVTEGDSGSTNLTFTLTLSKASTQEVRVRFSDRGTGAATAGTDYPAFSIQWLYFQPGELTKTVSISVTGDTVKEPNETIVVELLYPLHATIATPTGTGTITDDDTTPGLSISSPQVTEGDSGSKNLTYTASLTAAGTRQVTVNYADAGTGTATSGTDYTAITGGTLTFSVGTTSQDITVSVTGDTTVEPHETVVVSLSNASGATILTAAGTGTITNDDGASSVSVSSLSVAEASTAIRFTVTLSAARSESVRVTWWDTGEGTATEGRDYSTRYRSPGSAWLTFSPGEVSKTTDQIWVRTDALEESDETIIVAASEAADGTGRVTGTATIEDDDGPSLSISSPRVTEGDSGSKNLTFTVTLNPASSRQVTVDWAEGIGGTATSGTDYTAITGGTLTFAAGTTSRTFDVSVTGDTTDEADETVVVTLSNAANAMISTATGTGTITDNDAAPSLFIDSPRVTEGDSGSRNLTFKVTLSAASGKQVTVDWAEETGGTATSGTDYTAITGGTLIFAVGTTSRTFDVSVTGDTDEEPNETVVVTLSNAANATIPTAAGTGTIVNDDGVTVSIDSPSVTEGDSGSKNLTFTVSLSKASTQQVTVIYVNAGTGTATSRTDYTAISSRALIFAVGTTSRTFDVSVIGDTLDEADETVAVTLYSASGATISTATGTGTITDNDPRPSLSISSPSVTEGGSGSKNLTFTATLSAASGRQVTVDWAEGTGGTATSGTDYTAITGGTLTFPAGTTSRTFNVSVTGDTDEEPNETVVVTLSNAANAMISTATGTGTIVNDDGVTVSIDSPSVTEGDSGSKDLTFTATLNKASTEQVTVDWAEGTGGTATSGTDYTAITGGTLTFAVGTTSQTFSVSVTGDTTDEADETVVVTLSNAANATVSAATGTGTITDDDDPPSLSIDSPSVIEGDSGSTNLKFTVTLSAASSKQVTVDWAEGTSGTATSGTDFTAITGGTLTFAVGTTSQTFDVSVTGDTTDEADETVVVTLSNAVNATTSTATGTGMITDDDAAPSLSIDSPRVTEGDSGSTNLTFTVTLSAASGKQVTVQYADAGTGTATSGTDYTAITGGTLTFAVGTTSRTFDVSVTGDTDEESNETVVAMLSNAANATVSTTAGTGTIFNDDGVPALSIDSPRVTEGDSGSKNLTFTVTLNEAGTEQVTVDWAEGTGGTATSGTDYTAIIGGSLTFAAGTTSQTFNVSVTGDTDEEPNETVVVTLGNAANATISAATGTGTIVNDDGVTVSINSPSVTEGDSGSTNLTFTATLNKSSTQQVTVDWAEGTGGTATSGTDYTAITGGTLTFAAGTTSQTFDVSVTGDVLDESNETVVVSLSNAANATISTATGTGTITDDDTAPTLSIDSPSVTEGNSGSATLTYTVTLDTASGQQVTVQYADAGTGTAISGTDYTAITGGTLTFTAGTTSQTFHVSVTGDVLDESNETVLVSLSAPTNAVVSNTAGTGTGTITDDDGAPTSITLTVDDNSVGEGDGATTITVTATVDGTTRFATATTVTVSVAGSGTATAVDFAAVSSFDIEIAAGAESETETFTLTPTDDAVDETNETVTVSGTSGSRTVNSATITLTDDDDAPTSITLTVDDDAVGEGDGATTITVTAAVDGTTRFATATTVTVSVAGSGTATAVDFAAVSSFDIEIAAGAESETETFTLTPTDDAVDETNETITVSGTSGSLTVNSATITLTDDDAAPTSITLTVNDDAVSEGDGATTITVTATVDGATRFATATTVTVSVGGSGTASAVDFAAVSSFDISIAAGAESGNETFTLTPTDDTADETDETITVSGTSGSLTVNSATISLTDDDGAPTLSIDSPSVTEGDSGSTNLTFTVSLSPASGQQVTVQYADAGTGTATSGTDYTAITGGTLTFAAGTTSQTFAVSVTGDVLDESNETVLVSLSAPTNAAVSNTAGTGTGTITDDDGAPSSITLTVDDNSVGEGDGATTITVTATVDGTTRFATAKTVTVSVAGSGTATAVDFAAVSSFDIEIDAGAESETETFTLTPTDDAVDETDETVTVRGTSSGLTVSSATITLTDDDAAPTAITLTVDDNSVGEGDGATTITVTATVDGTTRFAEAKTVSVSVAGSGTATAVDFAAVSSFDIEIAAEAESDTETFTLTPTDDTADETDETITVSGTSGSVTVNSATITLTDDDGTPTLSIDSPSVTEGDSGSKNLTFTVSLSPASGKQVTVQYADVGTGTATSGTDYTAITGGTLTFAVGTTSQTFNVSVTGDTTVEPHETVVVSLSNASGATIMSAAGTGTISNDDGASSLSIDSPSVTEGDSGSKNLTFTVTLSAASTEEVRVRFSDKGTGTATAGTDYPAFSLQWLDFQPGEFTKTVSISVTGDTVKEPNETIVVELLHPQHATVATPTGTGTITDDDTTPGLSISSPRVTEGDSGSKNLTYTVSLTAAGTQQVTVNYADAGTGTATSGTDYTAITGGTLTFAVGITSQDITVSVTGDTTVEPHETVAVSLSNASGATIVSAAGTGTIINDDGASSLSVSSPSVTEADTTIRFTVTLSAARSESVRVTWWDTGEGTATAGQDYSTRYRSPGSAWLTFSPGEVSKTTDQIWVRADALEEGDETIIVAVSEAADGTGRVTGTATIKDDEGPALSIDSPRVTEGDSGSTNLTFTVTLDEASTRQVTVDYADAGTGAATSGTDYTAITGGTLTFAVGITSQTFDVSVTGDTTDEADETVAVTLSNASGATISTATGTGTITDDDDPPSLSIDSPRVTEGDSGSTNLTFTATLSAASGKQVTVDWAEGTGGTATSGTDYMAITGGTLTFAVGTTSQTFDVSVTGDTTEESNETVVATLSNAANATISTATGTGTIVNDDGVTVSIDSPSVTEGDSGSKNLTFTATLSKAGTRQVTVDWAEGTGGTATSGTDYTAITGGTLTFAVGTTSQTFDVSVTGDTTEEADETVVVTLSNAANATVLTATGTGTITNDDGGIVSIDSPSVTEGDSGSKNLTFTVTLSPASSQQVTVDWAEGTGGTATSGTDYTAITGGTLTFPVGATSQTFDVSVTGDTTDEADETVVVTLSNASGATISTATGTGTIVNDDDVLVSIDSPSVTEGDSGSKNLTFTVTLDKAGTEQVTVDYADAGTGTAISGTDYTAITGGTLTFAVGTTSQTFDVSVTGDTDEESNETVVLTLSNAANATISTATGTGTIVNDDGVVVSIDSPSVSEGDSGSTNLTFTATLSKASTGQVTVDYADAGTGTATSGTDYTAITGGTLTFTAGTTSQTFDVSVTGDTTDEANETVVVTLSNAANATISTATGTGTIVNDDGVRVSIDSPSVTEGDSGSKNLTFTATLNKAGAEQVTVDYADAGSGTATSGTDYTAITGGTLTFTAGTTSQTFDVSVTGDTTDEADETVLVTLSNAANATIGTATGTGTITDNDPEPSLSIDSPSVTEGNSGSKNLTFTVKLSAASGRRVTVDYGDAGVGTAAPGTDYTAITDGTLTFEPGDTEETFDVSVTGDTDGERNETIRVTLSNATNATIGTATGTGTITDDDAPHSLSIDSPTVEERNRGSRMLTFTLKLSRVHEEEVWLYLRNAGTGTATPGTDYTAFPAQWVLFEPGETTKKLSVSVAGDRVKESDETVVAELLFVWQGTATISTRYGTGTITDDDTTPGLSISSPRVTEGNSGSTTLTYAVTLSATISGQVTVDYADASTGTATSGTDYTAITGGTLTFAPGDASKDITVSVTGDTTVEPHETVTVLLSNPANATILTATGTGVIANDDGTSSLSISSPTGTEGTGGPASTLRFIVTLSSARSETATVQLGDARTGTATSGVDYGALQGQQLLEFAPGEVSKTFDLPVVTDSLDEPNETVVLAAEVFGDPQSRVTGTGTITDDDPTPTLSIDSPSVNEGDSSTRMLNWTVSLSAESGREVTVAYAQGTGGTATSGTDHTALVGGTLTFAPGDTTKTFGVSVTGDTDEEPNETVVATLSGATNATLSTATSTGTIVNDDGVLVSIDSPSVTEGDSGSKNLTFTATLSTASTGQVTVDYADAGTGTAASGTDYTAIAGGTLTFAAGTTSRTFDVSVTGDTTDEANETILVTLSNASGATVSTATGTGTITDNDGAPTLSIDSPSVTEGDSGSKNLTYTVTLSAASGKRVTVDYADTETGTALAGVDYTTVTGGSLTFEAGTTTRTFAVSVIGDTLSEADETILVSLGSPTNATVSSTAGTGTGTITDDETPSTLSISSPSVNEGNSGSKTLTYTVTLSPASGQEVTVDWTEGTGSTATSGTDYTAITGGSLTFPTGTTRREITVSVTGDTTEEPNETVVVTLSNASGATIATGTGTGTIVNDDGYLLSIDSPSVAEGDSGSANLTFTVTLSAAKSQQVTVAYADAGTGTATSGTDYTAITAGVLTFAANETSKTITVSVTGDASDEENETVEVTLSSAVGATISTATGTGTITDNDGVPTLSIGSPSVLEGNSGSATLTWAVTLSPASGKQVTVNYADAGTGTATSGTDYTAITAGALTFTAGTTSRTFDVSVTGDTDLEPNETILVSLSSPTNAAVSSTAGTGTGTITDDDGTPTFSISSPSVVEGNSGSATLSYVVTLFPASAEQLRVRFTDAGTGTATAGTDYPPIRLQWLRFAAGETRKTVSVAVTGDTVKEPNETVVAELFLASQDTGATLGTRYGTGTITDDDTTPGLSISSPQVTEGNSGSATLTYTVTLTAAASRQVTVSYADAGTGTATSGTDYTAISGGTLTFAAGTTSQTFDVSVTGDTTVEPHETVVARLSNASGATILTATGTGTIANDDGASSLSVSSPTAVESTAGGATLHDAVHGDPERGAFAVGAGVLVGHWDRHGDRRPRLSRAGCQGSGPAVTDLRRRGNQQNR